MLTLRAYAKINLTLDILHKRADGFHEVAMVMQTIGLADQVDIREQPELITVNCDFNGLTGDRTNLAYRAARLLQETFGIRRGAEITLRKKIPLAAGLAGGSADAAAVLRGLNILWELGLADTQLATLAAGLGSDVPFCLRGGTALATGRGERLTQLPDLPPWGVVLAKPAIKVSTAWAYGNYRPAAVTDHPDTAGLVRCIRQADLNGVARRLGNVLESVTVHTYPELDRLKKLLVAQGALAGLMSGSGPTVFGLTEDIQQARYIAGKIKDRCAAEIVAAEFVAKGRG